MSMFELVSFSLVRLSKVRGAKKIEKTSLNGSKNEETRWVPQASHFNDFGEGIVPSPPAMGITFVRSNLSLSRAVVE